MERVEFLYVDNDDKSGFTRRLDVSRTRQIWDKFEIAISRTYNRNKCIIATFRIRVDVAERCTSKKYFMFGMYDNV